MVLRATCSAYACRSRGTRSRSASVDCTFVATSGEEHEADEAEHGVTGVLPRPAPWSVSAQRMTSRDRTRRALMSGARPGAHTVSTQGGGSRSELDRVAVGLQGPWWRNELAPHAVFAMVYTVIRPL